MTRRCLPTPKVMRHLLLLALATSVTACDVTTQSTEISTPEGRRGFVVECNNSTARCMREAGERCPNGYDVLDSGQQRREFNLNFANSNAPPSHVDHFTLTIQCH